MLSDNDLSAVARESGIEEYSIVISPLDGAGPTLAVQTRLDLYPASMIKTPLAVAVAVAESARRLSWTEPLDVLPANMTFNDAPSPLSLGARATVEELVDLMLERSDNVATNMLIDRVGRVAASADLAALGFERTAIRRKVSGALPLLADPDATGRNTHPAAEAAALFARIAHGNVAGATRIRHALERQYWNSKLPAGLEPDDRFAHKTGDTDEVSHDGGILTLASGERFVLVVYTALCSNAENDAKLRTFMRSLRKRLVRPNFDSIS